MDSKQAEQIYGHDEKETTPASELEEEMSEEDEEEMTDDDEAATDGSSCGMVASRACRAAVAVAMLAIICIAKSIN